MSADLPAMDIAYRAMRAKDSWVVQCSRKHMPDHIVKWIEAGNVGEHLEQCVRYVGHHNLREEIWANGWRYFRKGALYLGAFRFLIKGTRVTITSTVFDEPVTELPIQFKGKAPPGARYPSFDEL